MKKVLALIAVGAFTVAASASALACGFGKMAQTESAPITTALDSQPITSKPEARSGS